MESRPLTRFHKKLKLLKERLIKLNKGSFSHITYGVKHVENERMFVEQAYELDPSEDSRRNMCKAQVKLVEKLKIEKQFCRQKANLKWLK